MSPSENELSEFLESLDDELQYFKLNIDRVMNATWIIPEYIDNKLVAISAVEKKHGIFRSWTMVKKEHWGKGIASRLCRRRKQKCRNERLCHILLALIDKDNIASITSATNAGYKRVGRKGNLVYFAQPITRFGFTLIWGIKMMFPLFSKFR